MISFPFNCVGASTLSSQVLINLAPSAMARLTDHDTQALGRLLHGSGIPAVHHAPAVYQLAVGYGLSRPLPATHMDLYRIIYRLAKASDSTEIKEWVNSLGDVDYTAGMARAEERESEFVWRIEHLVQTRSWETDRRVDLILQGVTRQYEDFFGPGQVEDIPELWLSYMQLRLQAHKQVHADMECRLANNPRPTEEERAMFTFYEGLEPQVRDAVLTLRRKGYPTDISGFLVAGPQVIRFEDSISLSEEITNDLLETYGVVVRTTPNAISFLPSRLLTLGELKIIWDTIAEAVADLNRPVPAISGYQNEKWKARFRS